MSSLVSNEVLDEVAEVDDCSAMMDVTRNASCHFISVFGSRNGLFAHGQGRLGKLSEDCHKIVLKYLNPRNDYSTSNRQTTIYYYYYNS